MFSGKGIYPLLSSLYLKEKSRWLNAAAFSSKIGIQMHHLSMLVEMNLSFTCVLMDKWYFARKLTDHIQSLGKDWIAEAKSNRQVRSKRQWICLRQFSEQLIHMDSFKVIDLGEKRYFMKACTVQMKNIGNVRVFISLNKNGTYRFYTSNRLDWNELDVATRYSR